MGVQQLVVMQGNILKCERLMKVYEISMLEELHLLRVVMFIARLAEGRRA
jgi:hypothetical protein